MSRIPLTNNKQKQNVDKTFANMLRHRYPCLSKYLNVLSRYSGADSESPKDPKLAPKIHAHFQPAFPVHGPAAGGSFCNRSKTLIKRCQNVRKKRWTKTLTKRSPKTLEKPFPKKR